MSGLAVATGENDTLQAVALGVLDLLKRPHPVRFEHGTPPEFNQRNWGTRR